MAAIKKTAIDMGDLQQLKWARENVNGRKKRLTDEFLTEGKKLRDEIDYKFMRPAIRKLRKEPPERDRSKPVRWTSPKQRRYVMWLWKTGKITLPYKRTHKLSKGWRSKVKFNKSADSRNRQVLTIEIVNDAKHDTWSGGKQEARDISVYVVGDIGIGESKSSKQRYARPQQRFHRDTGWQSAASIVRPAVRGAQQYARQRLESWGQR